MTRQKKSTCNTCGIDYTYNSTQNIRLCNDCSVKKQNERYLYKKGGRHLLIKSVLQKELIEVYAEKKKDSDMVCYTLFTNGKKWKSIYKIFDKAGIKAAESLFQAYEIELQIREMETETDKFYF